MPAMILIHFLISFLYPHLGIRGKDPLQVKSRIPVLCYHQVRDLKNTDTRSNRQYIIPPETFASHMKILHDSGYTIINPEEIMTAFNDNSHLQKPIVITFDDGTKTEYKNALPVLKRYGFKAIFFIMTVTINKKAYLDAVQIKQLSEQGHLIGCHSWDHKNVKKYNTYDWAVELSTPKKFLEEITGKQVDYFAYPYGVWSSAAFEKLKLFGYKAAFQLSGKIDPANQEYTIPRILVDGSWNANMLLRAIEGSTNKN
jgi:peptidoglycan/xylan/chitin deacetylase (PgdA/CDA1 family)